MSDFKPKRKIYSEFPELHVEDGQQSARAKTKIQTHLLVKQLSTQLSI